jgi:tetratricopeptide (TPR) repeat protein
MTKVAACTTKLAECTGDHVMHAGAFVVHTRSGVVHHRRLVMHHCALPMTVMCTAVHNCMPGMHRRPLLVHKREPEMHAAAPEMHVVRLRASTTRFPVHPTTLQPSLGLAVLGAARTWNAPSGVRFLCLLLPIALAQMACGSARPPPAAVPAPKLDDRIALLEGDYAEAVDRGRAAHHPIVAVVCSRESLDCLLLRERTLHAPAMLAKARSYVWLWIDVDRDAALLDGVGPVDVGHVPSITVVDPETEKAVERWPVARAEGSVRGPPANALERRIVEDPLAAEYLASDHPERALRILEADARDFPDDWVPPLSTARAYDKLGQHHAALAAAERALRLAAGWAAVLVHATLADADLGLGRRDAARRELASALDLARAMPLAGARAASRAALEARLGNLQDER